MSAVLDSLKTVIAESNGHHWCAVPFRIRTLICCRDCGVIRRADDQNKPCPGVVRMRAMEVPISVSPSSFTKE